MFRAGFLVTNNVKRELERDCLVGVGAVEQWYRRADSFKVKVIKRVSQGTQEICDRSFVRVGLIADFTDFLYVLFPVKLVAIWYFFNGKDATIIKIEAFLATIIQVEDIVFWKKVPALGQGTFVRVSTVGPDIDIGAFFASHVFEHIIDPIEHPFASLLNQVGDIIDLEKCLRINLAIPGILVVDISEVTMIYEQTLAFAAVSLEGNVVDVHILD
jgi:hypothetical protein